MTSDRMDYLGVPVGHDNVDQYLLMGTCMVRERFELVVELGTLYGGLTCMFCDHAPHATVVTVDNEVKYHRQLAKRMLVRKPPLICLKADVLREEHEGVVNWLQSDRHKLLYCDNGSKTREVTMYAKHLRPGDLLGIHDWGVETHSDWNRLEGRWQQESTEADIAEMNEVLKKFKRLWKGKLTVMYKRVK